MSHASLHNLFCHHQHHRLRPHGHRQKQSHPGCLAHLGGFFIRSCPAGRCLRLHTGHEPLPPQDKALVFQIRHAHHFCVGSCRTDIPCTLNDDTTYSKQKPPCLTPTTPQKLWKPALNTGFSLTKPYVIESILFYSPALCFFRPQNMHQFHLRFPEQ